MQEPPQQPKLPAPIVVPGTYVVPRVRSEVARISQITPDFATAHLLAHGNKVESAIRKQQQIIEQRPADLKPFWMTFGFGQKLEGCYTVIFAKDEQEARNTMTLVYEQIWSMIYDSASKAGVEEYKLKLVPFGTANWRIKW